MSIYIRCQPHPRLLPDQCPGVQNCPPRRSRQIPHLVSHTALLPGRPISERAGTSRQRDPNAASCSSLWTDNNTRMPQPPPATLLHPVPPPAHPADMTETQKPPVFTQPAFLDHHSRRLPPLQIPPDSSVLPPPRSDYPFRSPINHQLPSIQPVPPPRHGPPQHQHQHQQHPPQHQHHHQHSLSRPGAPVEKLLHSTPQYTPPRSDAPSTYSPQQYGPPISPRTSFDSRAPPRLTEQRYPYEDARPAHHHPHEQPYGSLASPVEPSQRAYGSHASPGYTPSYASSSTPFRGSAGSLSHRNSIPNTLGPLAYPDAPTAGHPPRQDVRPIPLPGSIPQPVYNEQL
jgi:hypothetical protein